jgi:hypothetical protein
MSILSAPYVVRHSSSLSLWQTYVIHHATITHDKTMASNAIVKTDSPLIMDTIRGLSNSCKEVGETQPEFLPEPILHGPGAVLFLYIEITSRRVLTELGRCLRAFLCLVQAG